MPAVQHLEQLVANDRVRQEQNEKCIIVRLRSCFGMTHGRDATQIVQKNAAPQNARDNDHLKSPCHVETASQARAFQSDQSVDRGNQRLENCNKCFMNQFCEKRFVTKFATIRTCNNITKILWELKVEDHAHL